MGIIVDTNVIISAEKETSIPNFDKWQKYGNAYISVITTSELLVGVHRANNKSRQMRRSAFVENIIKTIPSIEFNLDAARIHAELHAHLANKGSIIGAHDLIIAATAICYGHAVLTGNIGEFKRIPGLKVLEFK